MNAKWCKCDKKTWIFGGGLVVLLVVAAMAVAAMSVNASGGSKSTTAWYAENAATPASQTAAGTTAPTPPSTMPSRYPKCFTTLQARSCPPSYMITNTPMVAQMSGNRKLTPGDESQMPFGFKGTPFGDLFSNPELRHFFQEYHGQPQIPWHGRVGTAQESLSILRVLY